MTEHWRELQRRRDGCCDLLARLKEAYDAQHDEIQRLRAKLAEYAELEAIIAVVKRTLKQ